jgi:hypothetical protein
MEALYGHKYFVLDRNSYIIFFLNFYVGYVQCSPLIILKQIWNDFTTDRPLIFHLKMNGPKIFSKFEGAYNDRSL